MKNSKNEKIGHFMTKDTIESITSKINKFVDG